MNNMIHSCPCSITLDYANASSQHFAKQFRTSIVRTARLNLAPCTATNSNQIEPEPPKGIQRQGSGDPELKKKGSQVSSFVRNTATTFAPRASTATRNPAYRGSLLYTIFGAQAWISLGAGALLSFNIAFPTDKPSIARLIGMWSVWMFTIPALRARECTSSEKEALNILFLLVPLLNIGLPFVWKSFPFIFTADCAALAAIYAWKIGLPGQTFTENQ